MTNPYQPSVSISEPMAGRPRLVLLATALACLAVASTWSNLFDLFSTYFRSDTTVHFHESRVLILLFLSLSIFCLWSEWFGSARLRNCVDFALAPLVLLTFVGLYRMIKRQLDLQELADNPSLSLGWLAFFVIWLYAAASFRHRFKIADCQSVHRGCEVERF
ncbi:hypothetical protein Q31a_13790 [Aureliella helgolandensis]|uniref:Uncharacterized protein n=1 Tax=Aureliella helgolandensis TaxID=2527968 RepID=A0A518G3C1_9BACT|nr:hypothetical protein Q31a_13790 [Aureliella helgolandensis]